MMNTKISLGIREGLKKSGIFQIRFQIFFESFREALKKEVILRAPMPKGY